MIKQKPTLHIFFLSRLVCNIQHNLFGTTNILNWWIFNNPSISARIFPKHSEDCTPEKGLKTLAKARPAQPRSPPSNEATRLARRLRWGQAPKSSVTVVHLVPPPTLRCHQLHGVLENGPSKSVIFLWRHPFIRDFPLPMSDIVRWNQRLVLDKCWTISTGWLSPTPLKNMSSSVGMIIPKIWEKQKQCSKPPTR